MEPVLPANASATRQDVEVHVACPSAGNCSAVGSYIDSSDNTEGLLLTETAGHWAPGVEAVPPGNPSTTPASTSQYVSISALSCPSAGNCSAVGSYIDNSGNTEGLLLNETAGQWASGVAAALPADAAANPLVSLNDVSCTSVGNCSAVGSYNSGVGIFPGLLLTETAGTWATGVEAVLPANARATYQAPDLRSVSCGSAGNCSAVGDYYDAAGMEGLLLNETAGSWSPGVEAVLPPSSGVQAPQINSVSCASAGNCTAVGEYAVGGAGLLLTETAGNWAPAVVAVPPANSGGNVWLLNSVSCASAGNCAAVGSYFDTAGNQEGLLLNETAGSWSPGVEALPVDAGTPGALPGLQSVSCASAGYCTAVGVYGDGSSIVPLLVTETAGSWSPGVVASLPANAITPYAVAGLSSVSCPPSGTCDAGGFYTDSSGNAQGLLTGDSAPVVTLKVLKDGDGSGTVSDVPTGIDCGSVCSASFTAGTSPTLTATPSPGSRFSGWSTARCPGAGSCQLPTVVSDQTVTAAFTLLQKCIVPRVKGRTLEAARNAIRSGSCRTGKITRARSRTIRKGHVISQKPRAHLHLPNGAKVSLVISKGRR
jgi:hypothetical protein